MKFYKLVEISQDEYVEQTRDLYMTYCNQTVSLANNDVYPDDKNVYVAIDESEEEIRIDSCYFNGELEDE